MAESGKIREIDSADSSDESTEFSYANDQTSVRNALQVSLSSMPGTVQEFGRNFLQNLIEHSEKLETVVAPTFVFKQTINEGDNIETSIAGSSGFTIDRSSNTYEKPSTTKKKATKSNDAAENETKGEIPFHFEDSIRVDHNLFLLYNERLAKYGEVYRGLQTHKGSRGFDLIAIKSIKLSDENRKEVEIIRKLRSHPNVITVLQSGTYFFGPTEYLFIAMEYFKSKTLTDFVKDDPKLKTDEVKHKQIEQFVEAVDHIHMNEVLHRDLKPDNILVSDNGRILKIIDFGLGKQLRKGHFVTKMSTLRVGTDGWRAPEIYLSDYCSKHSDIFSSALVIHFISTDGSHPFGNDPDSWNFNIKRYQGCDLSKLEGDLEDLVGWMLALKPQDRPDTEQIRKHKYFRGQLVCPHPKLGSVVRSAPEKEVVKVKEEFEERIKQIKLENEQEKRDVERMRREHEKEMKWMQEEKRKMEIEIEKLKTGKKAPSKLQNITASLEEKGNYIMVQCGIAERDCPFYFVQAYCNGLLEGHPLEGHSNTDKKVVEIKFNPKVPAEKYHFIMWGENSGKVRGKASISETVISRPAKTATPRVVMDEENSSSAIHISWIPQQRCEEYEVQIYCADKKTTENILKSSATNCEYICRYPGSKYMVMVRSIRCNIRGEWSHHCDVILAPLKVELIEDQYQHPVKFFEINWKPLEAKPDGYRIALYKGESVIKTDETNRTNFSFGERLEPGTMLHCSVAAFNAGGTGKTATSKYYRIGGMKSSFFAIIPDDTNPSKCAYMTWEKPTGVDCFKLQIENNQNGFVSEYFPTNNNFVFKSGVPGNTYTIRQYCGYNSVFDLNHNTKQMIMKPYAPHNIRVLPKKEINGLCVEFEDHSNIKKTYEVLAEPLRNSEEVTRMKTDEHYATLKNLTPGESYKIKIKALVGETCSKEALTDGYVSTFPDKVCNIKTRFDDKKNIVYEWDPLDIEPDGYEIQWRIAQEKIIDEKSSTCRFTIDGPKTGHNYSARIVAYNKAGYGKMSDWKSISVMDANSAKKQSQRNTMSCNEKDSPSTHSDPANESTGVITIEHGEITFKRCEQIRKGSRVFRARRKAAGENDENIVVKIVGKSQILGDIALYKREVDNMRNASRHPNVVTYFGSDDITFDYEECIYIAMEECESESVWDKIKTRIVSYAKRKFDVKGMAEGLRHIHGRHILHRDLKPQNILYKDGIVVISDFGLSKRLDHGKSNTLASRPNVGTDGWRAPETSGDEAVTSIYADVFSAGLVMFYILTNGKHPFGKRPHCWQAYIEDDTGMSLQTLYETPDSNIAIDLIASMLQRDPKTRPTMIEVLGHPFFWSDQRRLEFYGDVMKGMELLKKINERKNSDDKKNGNDAPHLFLDDVQSDDMYAHNVKSDLKKWEEKDLMFTDDELNEIQSRYTEKKVSVVVQKDAMKTKAKKFGFTVTELLRFIRNRHTHNHEDKGEGSFDQTIEEFWKFFFDRFPFFFLYIYYKAKKYFENKSKEDEYYSDTMARYFVKSSDTDFEGLC
ncbi:uncharacterized protein LOC144428262 [Styela clava]